MHPEDEAFAAEPSEAAAAPANAPAGSLARLLELVSSGAVVPLRGSYVLELARSGKRLEKRQDLPVSAVWTGAQLSSLLTKLSNRFGDEEAERRFATLFVAVAARWLADEHPDPNGRQLAVLASVSQSYLQPPSAVLPSVPRTWREATVRSEIFDAVGHSGGADFALLWEYTVRVTAAPPPSRCVSVRAVFAPPQCPAERI